MKTLLGVLLAVTASSCSPHRLNDTQPAADALAREVLSAISRRDEARLQALAISEEEFAKRVWPGLPAARPERNMPWSYVWLDLRQKSDGMLKRTLAEHGAKRYELQRVRFDGERTDHGSYRVFRETVLVVRDPSGAVQDIRVFGSMIEADGAWKVFSYVVD